MKSSLLTGSPPLTSNNVKFSEDITQENKRILKTACVYDFKLKYFLLLTPSSHNFLMRTGPFKDFTCYICLFLSILNASLSCKKKAFFLPSCFTSYYFQDVCHIKDELKDFRVKMRHARPIIKDYTQIYVSHSEKCPNNQTIGSKLQLVTSLSTGTQTFSLQLPHITSY